MKKTLFIFIACLSVNNFAQSDPKELISTFFTTYEKNPGKAVKDLYATNPWTKSIEQTIEKIVDNVNGFTIELMGEYHGYERITSKQLADVYVVYSYLIKYDRQPVRFIFHFYKPNHKWMIYSFSVDDDLDEEMEETAKLNHLDFK